MKLSKKISMIYQLLVDVLTQNVRYNYRIKHKSLNSNNANYQIDF